MVVWLFAGGGQSEVRGLDPFLRQHFPTCSFVRQMPVSRKPGPKPRRVPPVQGLTGKSFVKRMHKQLDAALSRGEFCHLMLFLDDLDCRDAAKQRAAIEQVIDGLPQAAGLPRLIGFAAPEIEAWLLADWHHAVQPDRKLRKALTWLSQPDKKQTFRFEAPETFSQYEATKDSCQEKLSTLIQDAMLADKIYYSKATDTPRLLMRIDPEIVSQKCPHFRAWFAALSQFCAQTI